jgi:hypothetical protein
MRGLRLILILTLFLILVAVYTVAAPIPDNPDNIKEFGAFYDNRNYDAWKASQGGSEASNGAYLQIYIGVQLNSLLNNYNRVISVTAVHRESGLQFDLIGDDPCLTFAGTQDKFWALFLRPTPFVLTGIWDIILLYRAADGSGRHQQTVSWTMGQMPFPPKPSNIQLATDASGNFIVSWNAINNPCAPPPAIQCRVRVYDEQGSCVV